MHLPKERMHTILRFLVSGVLGFLSNLGMYELLLHGVGLWYVLASIVAFVFGLIVSFLLQKLFTFRDRALARTPRQVMLYLLFSLFNTAANAAMLFVFVEFAGLGKTISLIISNIFIAVWSFFLYEKIVFGVGAPQTGDELPEQPRSSMAQQSQS